MTESAAPTVLPAGGEPISIDAYTGAEVVTGTFSSRYDAWAVGAARVTARKTLVPTPADPAKWQDPRVGWGLVLPEREGVDAADLATADDAPEPIRQLAAARGAKVLRYRAGSTFADWTLRDYAGGGDRLNAASPVGTGPHEVPLYLLIYGSPGEIPWAVQYSLNPVRCVGRLDLTGAALEHYVAAVLDEWSDSGTRYESPLVWSVDHGGGDITTLMRDTVGAPVFERLAADPDMILARFLDGSHLPSTGAALRTALGECLPRLVVTTSHGMTGPLNDVAAMRDSLGLLVDHDHAAVPPGDLLDGWQPDGAIWFAQACCSAGADSPSAYAGLFDASTTLGQVLTGVAAVGATTAPLPRALLGAPKPLRAFIGHVEPTFNWTLSFPPNRQVLSADIVTAMYDRLCSGLPVGLALSLYYKPIASLLLAHSRAVGRFDVAVGTDAAQALDLAVYSKVTAYDRANLVVLGDPAVAMPLPGS